LATVCEDTYKGVWVEADTADPNRDAETAFYSNVFGGNLPNNIKAVDNNEYGYCIQDSVMYQCKAQDDATGNKGYVNYNATTGRCEFSNNWYVTKCAQIGGYWEIDVCYK
jgi:hypothetical protein